MCLPPRILLHSPVSDQAAVGPFVERCLRDGVVIIAVFGKGAEALEEEIDWLVVGDGDDDSRYVTTSCHEHDTYEEALIFAREWFYEQDGFLEVRL